MRRYEEVDAARVCRERRTVAGGQVAIRLLGDPAHPLPAHVAVALEKSRSQHLAERSAREPAQPLHLPQPVLRGNESLQKQGVVQVFGVDVRLAESVKGYDRGAI